MTSLTRTEKNMLRAWLRQFFVSSSLLTLSSDEVLSIEHYFLTEKNCHLMDTYQMYAMLHSDFIFTEAFSYLQKICEAVPSLDETPLHL